MKISSTAIALTISVLLTSVLSSVATADLGKIQSNTEFRGKVIWNLGTNSDAQQAARQAELEKKRQRIEVVSATASTQKAKIPFWAGHVSTIKDEFNNKLKISYSEDGKTFSVVWGYNDHFGKGVCSGKVEQSGKLETVDCMPLGKNIPRSIGGNIFKIKLLHY